MNQMGTLLEDMERHIRWSGLSPARFGVEAINDPCLVHEVRVRRVLRPSTEARVRAYMEAARAATTDDRVNER